MSTRTKFALVAVPSGLAAVVLTPILFPANPAMPVPDESLMPHFLVLGAAESSFFGFGVAFLALGLPVLRRIAAGSGVSPWPPYLAIGYLTASWWPHLGLHRVFGFDYGGMVVIDYLFHLPFIVSSITVAWFVFAISVGKADAAARRGPTAA